MPDQLTLRFSSAGALRLARVEFRPANGAPVLMSSERRERMHTRNSFRWSDGLALHALALAWVRHAVAQRRGSVAPELLAEDKAANAIDELCPQKKRRQWLEDILGDSPQVLLEKWFFRKNRSNTKAPRAVFSNPSAEGTLPLLVRVVDDKGTELSPAALAALVRDLAALYGQPEQSEEPEEPQKIKHLHLPRSTSELVGRDAELARLSAWFAAPGHTVFQVVAPGGLGKTSLVRTWLDQLPADLPVFAWSFYRQGYGAKAIQSLQEFFSAAEAAWDCKLPGQATPNEMAAPLARAFLARGGLLVLDGMEAITDTRGRQRHDLFGLLLNALATLSPDGVPVKLLVTTRVLVAASKEVAFPSDCMELLPLTDKTSRHLLRRLLEKRVSTPDAWLAQTSAECLGSPLLLGIAASLCIARKELIASLKSGQPRRAGTWSEEQALARLVDSYVQWLAGTPALALLMLASAYDRPTDAESLSHLLGTGHTPPSHPPLRGEWASWTVCSADRWLEMADLLRSSGIALPGTGLVIEMHPLIHAQVAASFRRDLQARWKDAHRSLRDYLAALPDDEMPETLPELQPLVRAVYHGCQAGDYQKAFDEIGWPRISRGPRAHLLLTTGTPAETLVTLSAYLNEGTSFPADSDLTWLTKGCVLYAAAAALGYLGRFIEARAFNKMSIHCFKRDNSFLARHLLLGAYSVRVRQALYSGPIRGATLLTIMKMKALAEKVDPEPPPEMQRFADRRLWLGLQAVSICYAALALDIAGLEDYADQALAHFRKIADELGHGLLGEEGCQYFSGRLLLRRGRWAEVWDAVQREETLRFEFAFIEQGNVHPLIGGWAQLEGCLAQNLPAGAPLVRSSREWLDQAVTAARAHGILYKTSETLLQRARWHLHYGMPDDFRADWNEAREIAHDQNLRVLLGDIVAVGKQFEKRYPGKGGMLSRLFRRPN